MPPVLEAINVSRRFEGNITVSVLETVSLAIQPAEFVAITGPSGSGKSTLLYILGALDQPNSGQLYIDGENIADMKEKERTRLRQQKIGFVFQFHYLLPEFTALENVALPGLLAGYSQQIANQRATSILNMVGLSHRLSHRPSQLSGGEQQRVALARALINSPRLVLADEPTGNLDTENTALVFSILRTLNQSEQTAMVIVTHNLDLASKADRIIHLVDGKIVP